VHARNRGLCFLIGSEFDEAEALGSARVAIHDDLRGDDRSVRSEHVL